MRRCRVPVFVLFSIGLSAAPSPREAAAAEPDADVAATVTMVLTSALHPEMAWPELPDVVATLKELYAGEPDHLFWFTDGQPVPGVASVVRALALADEHGLPRADYDADRLLEAWITLRSGAPVEPARRALFDLALTTDVARLVAAVQHGRVDPATLRWGYEAVPRSLDRAKVLRDLRGSGDLARLLGELQPPFSHYARAKATLARYKKMAATEPPLVPALAKGQKIEPGKPWAGVPALAARLRALGDLRAEPATAAAPAAGDALYQGPLVEAVKSFQRRHGLEPDGVIGRDTVAALDVSLAQRVRQLELAMERMRWLPDMSERPSVFVNLPLFRLWASDPKTGEEPVRMNVVVGKSMGHMTPVFLDQMEYVIFRPYWNPPYSIIVNEIVPHARRDPGYLARENMEIVASGDDGAEALATTAENLSGVLAGRLRLRQKPGPRNSLGLAKFIFPNADNIYMHGTPAPQVFARARRDFSHGCIRLEDPARLAEWVLRDQPEWTRAKIDAAMQGERPTRVNLKQKLSVVLFYDTVHVNSEGVVFFVSDIYGDDRQLDAVLAQGYPYPTRR